jgi:hypothetical protein
MSGCECKRDSAQPSRKWWRFAQCFVKDAAPKAPPKMTDDN